VTTALFAIFIVSPQIPFNKVIAIKAMNNIFIVAFCASNMMTWQTREKQLAGRLLLNGSSLRTHRSY
jgi:hypothetical protein